MKTARRVNQIKYPVDGVGQPRTVDTKMKLLSWLHGALLTTGIHDMTRLRMGHHSCHRPSLLGTRKRVCQPGNEESVVLSSSKTFLVDQLFALARELLGLARSNQKVPIEIGVATVLGARSDELSTRWRQEEEHKKAGKIQILHEII